GQRRRGQRLQQPRGTGIGEGNPGAGIGDQVCEFGRGAAGIGEHDHATRPQRPEVTAQEPQAGPGGQQHPVAWPKPPCQPARYPPGVGVKLRVRDRLPVDGDRDPVRHPARGGGGQLGDRSLAQPADVGGRITDAGKVRPPPGAAPLLAGAYPVAGLCAGDRPLDGLCAGDRPLAGVRSGACPLAGLRTGTHPPADAITWVHAALFASRPACSRSSRPPAAVTLLTLADALCPCAARSSAMAAATGPGSSSTRLTRPMASASAAPTQRPVRARSIAVPRPTRSVSTQAPTASPWPAGPIQRSLAAGPAIRRSAAAASWAPPPTAAPVTTASTGPGLVIMIS